jgi:solute carrier family 25 (mitochondrial phosphate transporter), member 3
MSYLYPRYDTLQQNFALPLAFSHPHYVLRPQNGMKAKTSTYQGRPELYGTYSVVDDAKAKTKQLGAEASKEFEKASAAAQSKAGKIELYSGKYYAACTFGGLLACVGSQVTRLITQG